MLKCQYCEREFERPQGLGNHIKSFHPDKYTPKKQVITKPENLIEVPKRKYNKKQVPTKGLHFCPNCGINLQFVEGAMSL